jgi:serine/threonine protein kinase
VSAYLKDGSLEDYLSRVRTKQLSSSWRDRLDIVKQVTSAMMHMHEKRTIPESSPLRPPDTFPFNSDIINRNLKPSNVLFAELATLKVQICDFSLARAVSEQSAAMSVVGTELYVAPEIILQQTHSYPADVFSFGNYLYCHSLESAHTETGILLYDVITVKPPRRRSPLHDYAFFPDILAKPADVPEGLWQLMLECVRLLFATDYEI